MKVKLLFAQRKCSYDGEYAPELLAAIDQHCYDECPEVFEEECEKALKSMGNALVSHKIIEIDIPSSDIDRALSLTSKAKAFSVGTE